MVSIAPVPVLQVKELTKRYGDVLAVKGVSFSLAQGEVLGLLGPNGAGKSSIVQMLLGLTTPTSGSITYFGQEFATHRETSLARINFASAYAQVNGKLTVWQNMRIFAGLYGVLQPTARIQEVAELLEINDFLNTTFWSLSSGQQTRVVLAKSLLNKPEILLMDEPTASLDPDIADKVMTLVLKMKQHEKVSILFTSHNMEEVARVCDRVIFLQLGEIRAVDTPLGLTKMVGDSKVLVTYEGSKEKVTTFLVARKLRATYPRPEQIEIELPEPQIPGFLFDLNKLGLWITQIEIKKPTLEDFFLSFSRDYSKAAPPGVSS